MYIKRWTTKQKHTIEATINLRDWMVGIGFDYDMYYYQVFEPIVQGLGLTKADLRRRNSSREIVAVGAKA